MYLITQTLTAPRNTESRDKTAVWETGRDKSAVWGVTLPHSDSSIMLC